MNRLTLQKKTARTTIRESREALLDIKERVTRAVFAGDPLYACVDLNEFQQAINTVCDELAFALSSPKIRGGAA